MAGSRSTAPLNRSNSVLIVACPLSALRSMVTYHTALGQGAPACPARRNETIVFSGAAASGNLETGYEFCQVLSHLFQRGQVNVHHVSGIEEVHRHVRAHVRIQGHVAEGVLGGEKWRRQVEVAVGYEYLE